MSTATDRYHPTLMALHWLTLALLAAVYLLIELHDGLPKGSGARALAKTWHETLGVAVFAVVLLRLPLRLVLSVPAALPGTPAWQARLAHAMHWALYALLIAAPILGYLSLNAKGTPVPFFGLQMPVFIVPDKLLAGNLKEIHETLGTLGYWLIGLHATAALVHHWILHDATLERMAWQRRPAHPPGINPPPAAPPHGRA